MLARRAIIIFAVGSWCGGEASEAFATTPVAFVPGMPIVLNGEVWRGDFVIERSVNSWGELAKRVPLALVVGELGVRQRTDAGYDVFLTVPPEGRIGPRAQGQRAYVGHLNYFAVPPGDVPAIAGRSVSYSLDEALATLGDRRSGGARLTVEFWTVRPPAEGSRPSVGQIKIQQL